MTDNLKKWGGMTPEEKGALLLAHHEGKTIQVYRALDETWEKIKSPCWSEYHAYRVEPERETVTLYSDVPTWRFEDCGAGRPDYAIRFDIIDGEPVCDTISMWRIK